MERERADEEEERWWDEEERIMLRFVMLSVMSSRK